MNPDPITYLDDLRYSYEEWMDDALCAQTDPDMFFPEKGGSTENAKKVCAACTVRLECLEYALRHNERHGIWGGMSRTERVRFVRRRRGRAA